MNVWGKVALVLVIVGGIAGSILASKTFAVRASWTKELRDLKNRNESNEKALLVKREQNQKLSAEYQRHKVGYGVYWTDVETEIENRGEGLIRVDQLGTNQGLVVDDEGAPTVIYGFMPSGEGKYLYVGSFVVDSIGEDQSVLRATWRVRPSESGLWEDGAWRWRSQLPESETAKIDHLHNQLVYADEFEVAQENNKTIQEKLLQSSKKQLEERRDELLSQTEGLIQSLEKESNNRDKNLKELDDLRIELKQAVDLRTSLIEEIKQEKTKLPGASQPKAATKVSQKSSLK